MQPLWSNCCSVGTRWVSNDTYNITYWSVTSSKGFNQAYILSHGLHYHFSHLQTTRKLSFDLFKLSLYSVNYVFCHQSISISRKLFVWASKLRFLLLLFPQMHSHILLLNLSSCCSHIPLAHAHFLIYDRVGNCVRQYGLGSLPYLKSLLLSMADIQTDEGREYCLQYRGKV